MVQKSGDKGKWIAFLCTLVYADKRVLDMCQPEFRIALQ